LRLQKRTCARRGHRERFQEGVVGDGLLRLKATSGDDAKALDARFERDLLRQAGLAHAGLADEDEQPSLPARYRR
jgi:hypothetical protein